MSDAEHKPPGPSALLPEVYDDLRALAARYLRRERHGHTLEPTALVHEAYLRLSANDRLVLQDRAHFLHLAARAMRRILVDHARAKHALKRGGDRTRVTIGEALGIVDRSSEDVLVLDDALTRLAEHDPTAAEIVEMRFFGGLTEVEIAGELGRSERWVRQQWAFARAWLKREISAAPGA